MPAITNASSRAIRPMNPASGEILGAVECADEAEVRGAVDRARSSQRRWADVGVRKRIDVIRNFQRNLARKQREIAEAITREAGKPAAEALSTEVLVVLDGARFLIENAYRLLADETVPHGNIAAKMKRGRLIREPYGVIGIISPWNYPFSIPASEALAALAAGNAVVLKPSEFTPWVARELESLLLAAGLPEHVFQVVAGDGATGAALVESEIDKLIFTGSVSTGRRIAAMAGSRLLPVVLELGGKDPMLVLDDADLDVASSAAVWGAFMNAGQTCLSVERCYVHRSRYPEFLKACAEKAGKLRVGPGTDAGSDIGPLIHEKQIGIVEAQVQDALAAGARIVTGGQRLPKLGRNFYAPTVLADVNHQMRIMREETFGPVLPVMPFDTDEEAVALANDSEYGLAASVWTGNRERGEGLADRLQAGTVMINDVISCYGISEAPHGGMKASGIGRTHGQSGLEEMVRMKYVDSDLIPGIKKVWWYPYGKDFASGIEGFIGWQYARGRGGRIRGLFQSAGLLRNRKR